MAKFVKNPSGTVHSVDDDFEPLSGEEFAEEWSEGKWAVVGESDASAPLLGTEPDPIVHEHELREPSEPVIDESGPAQEPGEPDERESNDIQPATGEIVSDSADGVPVEIVGEKVEEAAK